MGNLLNYDFIIGMFLGNTKIYRKREMTVSNQHSLISQFWRWIYKTNLITEKHMLVLKDA